MRRPCFKEKDRRRAGANTTEKVIYIRSLADAKCDSAVRPKGLSAHRRRAGANTTEKLIGIRSLVRTRNVIPPCARWGSRSKKPFPMNTRLECRQSHSLRTSFSFSASQFSIFNFPFSILIFPSLAQLDRVSDSDSEGRGFESRKTGQEKSTYKSKCFFQLYSPCGE